MSDQFVYDIEEATDDFLELDDWKIGSLALGEGDTDAHLWAIRDLVRRLRRDDKELTENIRKIEALADHPSWNNRDIDNLHEQYYASVYQDAAHSMTVVAVLAPFVESMFKQGFIGIRRHLESRGRLPTSPHARSQMRSERQWDCQYVSTSPKANVVAGIIELTETTGLAAELPNDLHAILRALFGYRNKMLHFGFEWPEKERRAFALTIVEQHWPGEWFSASTSDGVPMMFYLSDGFVDHCLQSINAIIPGIGRFLRKSDY